MAEGALSLSVAVGSYPHTQALKSGRIAPPSCAWTSPKFRRSTVPSAPMVRERRFDVCEMAIATFLQAKFYGKQLVLLPVPFGAKTA